MLTNVNEFPEVISRCQNSSVGKLLPTALYVHISALKNLDSLLQAYEQRARKLIEYGDEVTLVKFTTDRPKISYLAYPDFDRDPHPKLHKSIIVDLLREEVQQRNYHHSQNPPILHRKETFVTPDYPLYEEFANLTQLEVSLGLLKNSRQIGTYAGWQQRLKKEGVDFVGHNLVCHLNRGTPVTAARKSVGGGTPLELIEQEGTVVLRRCNGDPLFSKQQHSIIEIERHKAAIIRREISRPVRLAIEAEILTEEKTFFDYGCGHGEDLKFLRDRGYTSSGWDPYYQPNQTCVSADIVNLGYIINVIEDTQERRSALLKAWELTKQVLIVSAQVLIDERQRGLVAYGDGIVTSRNTFQKYYQQEELKAYIDRVLAVDAIPVSLGIFFVFRDPTQAEAFRASRFHSRVSTPRVLAKIRNFEYYRELLSPLMEFYTKRGRLPVRGELAQEAAIKAEFKRYHTAFKLILQATDEQEWSAITEKRRQDLLIYLALANFTGRLSAQKLAPEVKEDFKALFGSYRQACFLADSILLTVGNMRKIGYLCQTSPCGKQLTNSLAVHISALEKLDPLLRLYEGCASRSFGRLEEANIVKLYYHQPKISYLYYPDFDNEAHPTIQTSMEIDMKHLTATYHDYSQDDNPPVLHRKEALVAPDYPLYKKFAKLTKQEEKLGLLSDRASIRFYQGWLHCLAKHNLTIKKYKLLAVKEQN